MYINLNKSLSENILFLKIISLWPTKNKKIYNLYKWFVIINLYLYNLAGIMYLWQNLNNVKEVTATVYNYFSTIAVIIKVHFFHSRFNCTEAALKIFEHVQFQPQNKKQRKILSSAVFQARFIFFYFCGTASIALACWIFIPMFDSKRGFPSKAWFPFDYFKSPFYEITYIWQSVFVFYHAAINVGMDPLFAMLMIIVGAQCEVLCNKLQNTKENNDGLKNCIIHHKLILKYTFIFVIFFRF